MVVYLSLAVSSSKISRRMMNPSSETLQQQMDTIHKYLSYDFDTGTEKLGLNFGAHRVSSLTFTLKQTGFGTGFFPVLIEQELLGEGTVMKANHLFVHQLKHCFDWNLGDKMEFTLTAHNSTDGATGVRCVRTKGSEGSGNLIIEPDGYVLRKVGVGYKEGETCWLRIKCLYNDETLLVVERRKNRTRDEALEAKGEISEQLKKRKRDDDGGETHARKSKKVHAPSIHTK